MTENKDDAAESVGYLVRWLSSLNYMGFGGVLMSQH